eukprot:1159542-Pelagomonas_calceolata.AAC.4
MARPCARQLLVCSAPPPRFLQWHPAHRCCAAPVAHPPLEAAAAAAASEYLQPAQHSQLALESMARAPQASAPAAVAAAASGGDVLLRQTPPKTEAAADGGPHVGVQTPTHHPLWPLPGALFVLSPPGVAAVQRRCPMRR